LKGQLKENSLKTVVLTVKKGLKNVSQSPKLFEKTVEENRLKTVILTVKWLKKRFHQAQNSLKGQLKKTVKKTVNSQMA